MSVLSDVRASLANALGSATGLTSIPNVPSEIRAGTVYVRPHRERPYIDAKDDVATYTRPAVNMQAVIVMPAIDVSHVQDKLDEYAEEIFAALATDPTLGGKVSDVTLDQISEPGVVAGNLIGVEITFAPFTAKNLTSQE